MPITETTMTIAGDRFATPGVVFPGGASKCGLYVPALDDASAIKVEIAPKLHRYNYPRVDSGNYATAGIVCEFDFDDADGTTITDNVNGYVLTEQGDPTFQTSAATIGLGKGLDFDGTGDAFDNLVANTPANMIITTGDFTVEMVVELTSAAGGAGDTLAAYRAGAAGVGWQLQLDANEYLDVHIEDADQEVAQAGATDVCTDALLHIACSFDRSGNLVTYLDGASNKTDAISTAEKTIAPAAGASNRFSIGGDAARTAGDCLTGSIYFFRLYNRALGATEILNNYRTLMNVGYPGWVPLLDLFDGDDLVVCKSGSAPGYFDLTRHLPSAESYAMRAVCATEQTTTPQALTFGWQFS